MVLLIICLHLQPPQTPQPPGRRADHLWRRRGWQKRQPSKMPFNQSVTMATATTGPEVPRVCVCVSYVQALLLFSFRGDGCHAQCGCLYILYCMSCPQYFHSSSFFFFPLSVSERTLWKQGVCVFFCSLVKSCAMKEKNIMVAELCVCLCVCPFSQKRMSWTRRGTWTSWWRMLIGLLTGLVDRKTFPPSKCQVSKMSVMFPWQLNTRSCLLSWEIGPSLMEYIWIKADWQKVCVNLWCWLDRKSVV